MNRTSIAWTDFTANPIRYRDRETGATVWACVKVSDGCKACYAEALAERFHRGGPFTVSQMAKVEPFLDEKELDKLLRSKAMSGKRCFVEDMSDLFGEWVTDDMLDRVFAVMALRPDVTWQVLTKRPERMRAYLTEGVSANARITLSMLDILDVKHDRELRQAFRDMTWPLPNVWLGVSVENQAMADERIPELLATPAAVHYLSMEPLLEAVDLRGPNQEPYHRHDPHCGCRLCPWLSGLDWVIVGGESGPKARPCDIEGIRSIVTQCHAAGVAVFTKQDSGPRPGMQGRIPDDLWIKEFPEVGRD